MKRKSSLAIGVIAALCIFVSSANAANLAGIVAPRNHQVLDFEPVEVVVQLFRGADPATFEAMLNGHDVTAKFEIDGDTMKADLTPADGLLAYEEGTPGNVHSRGKNMLKTCVSKNKRAKDRDTAVFFVKTGSVETTRDDRGVWFISGKINVSLYYVFEAMGYAVAQDRLWQMELYRRQGRGRLAEIFGPDQLETDVFMRIIGYSDDELETGFEALDDESRKAIKGYVAGINRRIAEILADPYLAELPFEFKALAAYLGSPLIPEPWTFKDVLAWEAILLRNFDPEALNTVQLDNAELLVRLQALSGDSLTGFAMFNDLRWTNDPSAPTYIHYGLQPPFSSPGTPCELGATIPGWNPEKAAKTMRKMRHNMIENLKRINAHVKMGSYAWVVSGDHTTSGHPIIYSGPQMGFPVPSIVMEGSIRAGGLDVSGMTVPGIPGIVIGRTPHHAWSMQVGHAHTTDYYFESPSDVDFHRLETIHVLGQADVQLPVYRSSHGPIVNPIPYVDGFVPTPENPIVAWKYSHWGYEFDTIPAFFKLARAKNMNQFHRGIRGVAVSQHFCYADTHGNIAYWMSGRDPVRPVDPIGNWSLPQGMLGAPLEWNAEVLLPLSTDRNTPRGWYAGWNNKSSAWYPGGFNSLSYLFGPFNRTHVIYDYLEDHLENGGKVSFDDIRALALFIASTDSFSGGGNPWKYVADAFTSAVNAEGSNTDREAALLLLADWDGHFVDGDWSSSMDRSDAWILMDAWIRQVLELTFMDELGVGGVLEEPDAVLFNVLLHGLEGVTLYDWFQNSDASLPQTAQDIIVTALDNVLAELGSIPWGEGERGLIQFKHDMLGPVHTMPFSSRSTYAHCVEYGIHGPVRIESMFPLGESGDIQMGSYGEPVFNPLFFSMTPVYDYFAHRPFPLFD